MLCGRLFAMWRRSAARTDSQYLTVSEVSAYVSRAKLEYEPRSSALALCTIGPALRIQLLVRVIVRFGFWCLISSTTPGACFAPALLSLLGCHALLRLPHHLAAEGRLLWPCKKGLAGTSDKHVTASRQGRATVRDLAAPACALICTAPSRSGTMQGIVEPKSSTPSTAFMVYGHPLRHSVVTRAACPQIRPIYSARRTSRTPSPLRHAREIADAATAPVSAAAPPPSPCWRRSAPPAAPASPPPRARPAVCAPRRAPCRCSRSSPAQDGTAKKLPRLWRRSSRPAAVLPADQVQPPTTLCTPSLQRLLEVPSSAQARTQSSERVHSAAAACSQDAMQVTHRQVPR